MRHSFLEDPQERDHPGLIPNPVARDLEGPSPWLARTLAAPVILAVLAGAAVLLEVRAAQRPPGRTVAVSLRTEFEVQPPAPGTRNVQDRLAGRGHRQGDDAVDRSLPAVEVRAEAPLTVHRFEAPAELPLTLPAQPQSAVVRKDLPERPGGTGLASGRGTDPGRGERRAELARMTRSWTGPVNPATGLPKGLRILRSVDAASRDPHLLPDPVRVVVRISAEGRPLEALAVSGDPAQFEVCEAAARQWLFQLDEELKARAPITIGILFHPYLRR